MLAILLAATVLAQQPDTITVTTSRFVSLRSQTFMGIERQAFVEVQMRSEGTDNYMDGTRLITFEGGRIDVLSASVDSRTMEGLVQTALIDESGRPKINKTEVTQNQVTGDMIFFSQGRSQTVDFDKRVDEMMEGYESDTVKIDKFKEIVGTRCQLQVRTVEHRGTKMETIEWIPVGGLDTYPDAFESTTYEIVDGERRLESYSRMLSYKVEEIPTPKNWPHIVDDEYINRLVRELQAN